MASNYPRLDLRSPGPSARRRSLLLKAITASSGAYLGLCLILVLGKCWITSAWWGFQVLHFSARVLFLFVPLGLLALTLSGRLLKGSLMNLASILLVAGPLMGITLNGLAGSASPKSSKPPIKVMTSNTGGSASHLLGLLWEIRRIAPDIILMQEVNRDSALVIDEQLADWKTLSLNGYLVAAKGDITHIADCITTPFQRKTAVACEVSTSEGPLMVINLHLTTARWGLQKLGMLSFLTNEGVQEFQEAERKRLEEALETREWVNQVTAGRRYIIGGDFNSPEEYDAYERAWGDLTNSFSFRGTGYGYTALCNKRAYWPDNFPWVRIDHLLHANEVRCHSVNVGRTGSSDHRTLTAEFTLGGSE